MNPVWSFLSSLTLKLVGPLLAYLKGRGDVERNHLEKEMKDAKESEAAWANRPRTDADALDRLLDAANKAKKP